MLFKIIPDVHFSIKPIYLFSRMVFCCSFKYVEDLILPLSVFERFLCLLVGLCHVGVLGWSLYYRNLSPRVNIHLSQSLLDAISSISATLLILIAMGRNAVEKTAVDSIKFFKQLSLIDKGLNYPEESYRKNRKYFFYKSMVQITLVALVSVVDNYMWISTKGWLISTFYFHSYAMYIVNNIVALQIDCKMVLLKERFAVLNERINALVKEASISNVKSDKPVTTKPTEEVIRGFNKIFDVLCDLIDSVNKSHGVEIIVLALTILTVALNTLVIGFTLFRSVSETENVVAISMQFLWSAHYIMMGIMLTSSSSATVKLANRTSILSHKLLLEYSSRLEDSEKLYYSKEELKLLIEQVAYRNPTFSAAGFFTVDYTMLYAIVGAVTSYFIVLLQLP